MDGSPPGSSVHGLLQARILEWVAISFSRGSSRPRDPTWVSHIAGRFFTVRATREAPRALKMRRKENPVDPYVRVVPQITAIQKGWCQQGPWLSGMA